MASPSLQPVLARLEIAQKDYESQRDLFLDTVRDSCHPHLPGPPDKILESLAQATEGLRTLQSLASVLAAVPPIPTASTACHGEESNLVFHETLEEALGVIERALRDTYIPPFLLGEARSVRRMKVAAKLQLRLSELARSLATLLAVGRELGLLALDLRPPDFSAAANRNGRHRA